jgi:hypothetical protein
MARRLAIAVGALSVVAAIGIAVALMVRSPTVARVSALGTISPSTTKPPAATTSPVRSSTRQAAPFPTATTVPFAPPPTAVRIGSIGVDASIVGVGLVPGTNRLEIPDIEHVGWYRLGPSPGQAGSSVLVGHVDGQGRPGVFWRLGRLTPGDIVTVSYEGGIARNFRVTGRQQVPKTALPADLFSRAGPPRLVLVTCGGAFDTTTRHYTDNVVIVAAPI